MYKKNKIDLLTLKDHGREFITDILTLTEDVKKDPVKYSKVLEGLNIALMFNKRSTRTRLSFEVGISQMGGNAIYLDADSLQLSRGENYRDTAKIFSGYLDGVVIRTFKQETIEVFAANSEIPVINGLTDSYHPCQILADLFTIKELGLLNNGLRFTYIGDGNNVTNSLMIGLSKLGIGITVCTPYEYAPDKALIDFCSNLSGASINLEEDPIKGALDADIIYTDVWISMGDENSSEKVKRLMPYQINDDILKQAKNDVRIMHCLPAHRGEEISAEVIDGTKSIVFHQAENRLYAQKALLAYIYNK